MRVLYRGTFYNNITIASLKWRATCAFCCIILYVCTSYDTRVCYIMLLLYIYTCIFYLYVGYIKKRTKNSRAYRSKENIKKKKNRYYNNTLFFSFASSFSSSDRLISNNAEFLFYFFFHL